MAWSVSYKNVIFEKDFNNHVNTRRARLIPCGAHAAAPGSRHRRPHAAPERRDPQVDDAARGQPGAGKSAQHQAGVSPRARDPRALPRHQPQRHRAAARRGAAVVPAGLDRHSHAARRYAAGAQPRAAGLRERPPGRRPARQSGARPGGAGGTPRSHGAWRPQCPPRLRRRRPHLHLRAGAAVAAMPRRPRSRARLPQRSQLRPLDEVLWRRRVDAGAGAEDAVARGVRSPAAGERERAAAARSCARATTSRTSSARAARCGGSTRRWRRWRAPTPRC